jgi:hypothetical protein
LQIFALALPLRGLFGLLADWFGVYRYYARKKAHWAVGWR